MNYSDAQAAKQKRPEGFPSPSNAKLQAIQGEVNSGKHDDALKQLGAFQPESTASVLWKNYFVGVANFANKDYEKGLKALSECYDGVKKSKAIETEHFRIAGMCLKKIGWFHRSKKDYHKATSYHNARYRYVRTYGSHLEIHDTLISLDVDAYYLGDMYMSVSLLEESLPHAQKISDLKKKLMALGTSYNNLGGSLYSVNKFSEAEESIKSALDHWIKYEEVAGEKENKVVWAYFGVADVYEAWAKNLKENKNEYAAKKAASIESYRKALGLAEKRKMKNDDKKYLKDRLSKVEAL